MKNLIIILLTIAYSHCQGSELQLSKPILYIEAESTYAVFNLSWKNAWRNKLNNDGVWLFCKSILNEGGYRHIGISDSGHSVVNTFSNGNPNLEFKVSDDGVGLFLFPSGEFRGDIEVTIKIILNRASFEGINTRNSSFTVFGIEMVKIPEGGYVLGDTDTTALKYGAFFQPKEGEYDGLVKVKSEDQELEISKNGDLYYDAPKGYEGDQTGRIPSVYPKGVRSFWIMKYEPTEDQYIDFLNSLGQDQLQHRMIHQAEGYADQGGTIVEIGGHFTTHFPGKPCAFMGWDDAMAFADWSGLRPMTEFEFTKAARGTSPLAMKFPWGTGIKEQVQRLPNTNGILLMLNGWDESKLSEETKKYFGASYYWVMDLGGSLWERVITVGHEKGRNFNGSHGDGVLSVEGKANNENWPNGDENSGGIGFRGGGFYGYDRAYHEFNPFSPIAYRPYGGWHGGMRTNSYGTRFVRKLD